MDKMHKMHILSSWVSLDNIPNNKVIVKDDESGILKIGNEKSGINIRDQIISELNDLARKNINNIDFSFDGINKEYNKKFDNINYNINTITNDNTNNNKKLNLTIKVFSNHGYKYLQLIHSFYVIENGKKVRKCIVIKNLGMLSKFDDGQPLFVERLRLSFKNNIPIIKELEEFVDHEAAKPCQPGESDFLLNGVLKPQELTSWESKNIGYFLLESIYNELGINNVLSLYKHRNDINYDINGIFKLLLIGRCLNPDSKLGTYEDKDRYLFDIATTENVNDVYNSLTIYDEKNITIQ
jgi:hypothetical protein